MFDFTQHIAYIKNQISITLDILDLLSYKYDTRIIYLGRKKRLEGGWSTDDEQEYIDCNANWLILSEMKHSLVGFYRYLTELEESAK